MFTKQLRQDLQHGYVTITVKHNFLWNFRY